MLMHFSSGTLFTTQCIILKSVNLTGQKMTFRFRYVSDSKQSQIQMWFGFCYVSDSMQSDSDLVSNSDSVTFSDSV